ncbi:c-type heme family protein [Ulvibacter litoralis]|uniref:Cytochrome c domain-containing protein n=1 Tax=Ulvibacter litoralis TaxID=227084 RepID=A0A1G7I889_9FLAO|nr:DUF3365 domain-containing protein [Ulvibacter litoralis]GHC62174.1 hypothetical protein GCM10008083_29100 [Ulvibacter litoralis]SDF08977.1 Protein of unknown function [Ulvibacter litoralis]
MKNITYLIFLSVLLYSCQETKHKEYSASQKQVEVNHPGKKLMETNCYVCHSPSATMEDRIGPPMIAIKKHYIGENTSKDEFVKAMQAWIENPNEKDAKMYGAVKRFGVMPKQAYPSETIAQIADYMFDYDIEQPEWFEEHYNSKNGGKQSQGQKKQHKKKFQKQQANATIDTLGYGERGLQYALATKAVLGKNLMGTIQKKGVNEALTFCNERAYPLTDSMSTVYNVAIKRVSDKPRNPNNQANAAELKYINSFKNDIKNAVEPTPIVDRQQDVVKVYYPITTNTMCLQCHGKPNENIEATTLKEIASLYPSDKATGYESNEVRGIWSITFPKTNNK